ncbi:hypothetical protein JXM83_00300 [Candidatus Woesearchaeota archaeon]|nr:hypothetical protein [Candidatus Woesearchaeota archaeon]
MKEFKRFIENGTVKEQSPDKSRAEFLKDESEKSYNFLQKKIKAFGISNETANDIIKSCYDIIMELIRAKMFLKGYNASGQGAHEAEVAYLQILGFKEKDIQFTDQLRYFRNGMLYYGTSLDEEYATKVVEFVNIIYSRLQK